jgi:uncharacterized protein (TIGR03084 family)
MSMAEMIGDLRAEQDSLDEVVALLSDDAWLIETPSPGWNVADQISHLMFFDHRAAMALSDPASFVVDRQDLMARAPHDASIDFGREQAPHELLSAWRESRRLLVAAAEQVDPTVRVPWYGPSMSVRSFLTARLMECWAHGEDVGVALLHSRMPTHRLRHVAHIGVGARAFSLAINALPEDVLPIRVDLLGPQGEQWCWGDEHSKNRVQGEALDFCLVVTQRRSLRDSRLEIIGDSAEQWMAVAQAFAGAPSKRSN